MISADPRYQRNFATVNGKRMAYVDEGQGDVIIFQHGNPTSSYLWRNIMPHCEGLGRLIACDLIGMGDSEKLDHSGPDCYTYLEQRDYLFALWEQLGIGGNVIFVIHDWGSALGFDWANRNRDKVAGIAYMEAVVRPMAWADFPDNARGIFQGFRSEAGEAMVLEKNIFVERVLPSAVIRDLTEAEMTIYRKETFGPVAPVIAFDDDETVLTMANDTHYGLAAYVYTNSLSRAMRSFEGLRFGIIGVNDINPTAAAAPFGGAKESGLGREGGREGIGEYLETKLGGFSI